MKLLLSFLLTFILLSSCTSKNSENEVGAELNGVKGKIFRVKPGEKSFEILKETVFDPKTNEGRSRFKVYWDDKTQFKVLTEQKDFKGIKGPVLADLNPVNARHAKAMTSGKDFYAKIITFGGNIKKAQGLSKNAKHFTVMFTPNPNNPSKGSFEMDGKTINVGIRTSGGKVQVYKNSGSKTISKGLWNTQIKGAWQGGKFICTSLTISSLPDPRISDDPKLPRVLVIGDSISMNYHEAAKTALSGTANYHRIEGNGGPSDRGANNVELWLGDYKEKGLHWDVIQFNHGLHDLKQAYNSQDNSWGTHQVSIADYKKNLRTEIEFLKKTGAKLIWCTTTPVPNSSHGKYARRKGEAAVFNKAALEVIKDYPEIQINDIHSLISKATEFEKWRQESEVHFYSKELQGMIGQAVADAVKKALSK